ncbi:hypothetical protein [Methylomarinum vadi]|uniref:hypothetical protein n=1 Tax=Methylomarinum vadi TaxID=438855 RepID=UPI001267C7A7|nr:hypothetical protein [Methylomarinum vadi]
MMKFEGLFPFFKTSELLVCETDGFSLRGAVVKRSGTSVEVLHRAAIAQVDMADAVTDLVETLQAKGWRGGGSAVLLSHAVLSTLVELPVNPKKPRPLPQMKALVQGDVEALWLQHSMRWSLGRLLVSRGYMTEEQVEVVMDLQQGKPNPAGGLEMLDKFSFRRFGELAEELGFVKRSQLNACLTGQEWLKVDDEQIECNWVPQGAVEEIPGTFNWLTSCVGQSLLQRWVEVFARQGVKLKAMYPLTGCAASLLPQRPLSEVLLESHHGLVKAVRLWEGRIIDWQAYWHVNKSAMELCLESYHALHVAPNETLWLASWDENAEDLAEELRRMLEVEVKLLHDPALDGSLTPGMLGAARHALGVGEPGRCIEVRVGGPLPPPAQRLEVRAVALAGVLLLGLVAAEASLQLRHSEAQSYKDEMDSRWQSISAAKKRIDAQIQAIEQRKQALREQQLEQRRLQAMLGFYERDIPERAALVKGILGMLQNSVGDEVIMIGLREGEAKAPAMPFPPNSPAAKDDRVEVESFMLESWAVSEAAAQTFIQTIQKAAAPWNLDVRDSRVFSGKGPLKLDGFSMTMRLVKLRPVDQVGQQDKA